MTLVLSLLFMGALEEGKAGLRGEQTREEKESGRIKQINIFLRYLYL